MDYINHCKIKSHKSFQEFINNKNNERIILMTTKARSSISQI